MTHVSLGLAKAKKPPSYFARAAIIASTLLFSACSTRLPPPPGAECIPQKQFLQCKQTTSISVPTAELSSKDCLMDDLPITGSATVGPVQINSSFFQITPDPQSNSAYDAVVQMRLADSCGGAINFSSGCFGEVVNSRTMFNSSTNLLPNYFNAITLSVAGVVEGKNSSVVFNYQTASCDASSLCYLAGGGIDEKGRLFRFINGTTIAPAPILFDNYQIHLEADGSLILKDLNDNFIQKLNPKGLTFLDYTFLLDDSFQFLNGITHIYVLYPCLKPSVP